MSFSLFAELSLFELNNYTIWQLEPWNVKIDEDKFCLNLNQKDRTPSCWAKSSSKFSPKKDILRHFQSVWKPATINGAKTAKFVSKWASYVAQQKLRRVHFQKSWAKFFSKNYELWTISMIKYEKLSQPNLNATKKRM